MIAATRSAALIGSLATVLAVSGCGVFAGSASEPTPRTACRTYLLEVGGQDAQAVRLLERAAHAGGRDNAQINATIHTVRKAATDAGLIANLPAKDFDLYRTLVDATVAARARARTPAGVAIAVSTGHHLDTAVKAVRDSCTTASARIK